MAHSMLLSSHACQASSTLKHKLSQIPLAMRALLESTALELVTATPQDCATVDGIALVGLSTACLILHPKEDSVRLVTTALKVTTSPTFHNCFRIPLLPYAPSQAPPTCCLAQEASTVNLLVLLNPPTTVQLDTIVLPAQLQPHQQMAALGTFVHQGAL